MGQLRYLFAHPCPSGTKSHPQPSSTRAGSRHLGEYPRIVIVTDAEVSLQNAKVRIRDECAPLQAIPEPIMQPGHQAAPYLVMLAMKMPRGVSPRHARTATGTFICVRLAVTATVAMTAAPHQYPIHSLSMIFRSLFIMRVLAPVARWLIVGFDLRVALRAEPIRRLHPNVCRPGYLDPRVLMQRRFLICKAMPRASRLLSPKLVPLRRASLRYHQRSARCLRIDSSLHTRAVGQHETATARSGLCRAGVRSTGKASTSVAP